MPGRAAAEVDPRHDGARIGPRPGRPRRRTRHADGLELPRRGHGQRRGLRHRQRNPDHGGVSHRGRGRRRGARTHRAPRLRLAGRQHRLRHGPHRIAAVRTRRRDPRLRRLRPHDRARAGVPGRMPERASRADRLGTVRRRGRQRRPGRLVPRVPALPEGRDLEVFRRGAPGAGRQRALRIPASLLRQRGRLRPVRRARRSPATTAAASRATPRPRSGIGWPPRGYGSRSFATAYTKATSAAWRAPPHRTGAARS